MAVIQNTGEFRRIANIPRRDYLAYADSAAALLTQNLRTDSGTQSLWPIQGAALADLYNYRGLFAPIKVSGGKTLLTLLAPTILEAQRPALLVPARLIEKTERAVKELAWNWRVAKHLRIYSYESLGRTGQVNALEEYGPDFIQADEAHRLKNKKAAVVRRVDRYMRHHPETMFAAYSGTFERRSIREYAHILLWCTGQSNYYPLPHGYLEMTEWSDCLDERDVADRPNPGAFLTLPGADDLDPYVSAKHAYRARLIQTPGVVASTDAEQIDVSLSVSDEQIPGDMSAIDKMIGSIRDTFETPEGYALSEAPQVWSHVRQLALGFYYRYVERPHEDWFLARREWATFVREKMRHNCGDSEKHVALNYPNCEELLTWNEWKESFKPRTEAVWISDTVVDHCVKWLHGHQRRIMWVDYIEFGERLSEKSGCPFFHKDACDARGNYVLDAKGPIIASIHSIHEGLDLQYKWSQNYIVSPMRNSGKLEQIEGRTHRVGQTEDEVSLVFGVNCIEHAEAIWFAITEAQHVYDLHGDKHKILYCDRDLKPVSFYNAKVGARWQNTK
jgi:hypothetical protein